MMKRGVLVHLFDSSERSKPVAQYLAAAAPAVGSTVLLVDNGHRPSLSTSWEVLAVEHVVRVGTAEGSDYAENRETGVTVLVRKAGSGKGGSDPTGEKQGQPETLPLQESASSATKTSNLSVELGRITPVCCDAPAVFDFALGARGRWVCVFCGSSWEVKSVPHVPCGFPSCRKCQGRLP